MIIDVSHHQGKIDWGEVAKHVRLAIIRSSNEFVTDTKWEENCAGARKAGVPYGTYHYLKAGTEAAAREEARYFYGVAAKQKPIFYVVDIEYETQTKETTLPVYRAFVEELRSLGAETVGVYIGTRRAYIEGYTDFVDFVWTPRYGKNTGEADPNYMPKYPCDLWQYTSVGRVPGINTVVDLNKTMNDTIENIVRRDTMAIKIGHASISENSTIRGSAGDQNGKEVFTRTWYKHSKGWVTLRFKDRRLAEYAAEAMEAACANDDIGYDQIENQTLWDNVKDKGFDPARTTKKVETDCARLIRVCVQYACERAGNGVQIPDFYTATLKSVLSKTGLFETLTASKYNDQDAYLLRGDIQVTKTKGHTWLILENGSKSGAENKPAEPEKRYELGERILKNGMEGDDVALLQEYLNQLGFDAGAVDGEFGDNTEQAVRAFQTAHNCDVDGEVGPETLGALEEALKDVSLKDARHVRIVNGNCYVRSAPKTSAAVMGVARKGEILPFDGVVSEDGWHLVQFNRQNGWVSGKYSVLEE